MHQSSLSLDSFGSSHERVQKALASLRAGGGVLVVDDEDRENEGDLIFPARTITVPQMAMLIRHCSGIVCLCLTDEYTRRLGLPMMTEHNTNTQQTAFTISIEAATGVTTGVSASDRVATIQAAVAENARPEDLRRP
ncbi:3,4-dihydroxy-2-butanone-4-phosphate synthase, partial [Desulfovibrio sp. 1214_IL3152]